MTDSAAIEQLNSVKYLYLREIVEPNKHAFNTLAIVVEEAVENLNGIVTPPPGCPELNAVFLGAHPIVSVAGCKTFRLYWKNYIAYLVTEEMAGSTAPKGSSEESYTGRIFREYTKSHFLDYIAANTGGRNEEPHHYRLVCLDHLIDVASCFPPDVEVLEPEPTVVEKSALH